MKLTGEDDETQGDYSSRQPSLTAAVIMIVLTLWYLFWLATPVNMFTADLGRHITNGRVLWQQWSAEGWVMLSTNFYSYTHADFPTVNHHWGSGLLLFIAEEIGGITGTQVLFIGISCMAYLLTLDLARRLASIWVVLPLALLLTPLVAARAEVRPEALSYLFLLLFVWLLWRSSTKQISQKWLWLLPLLQIVWVNTHIYFVFGIYVTGVWLISHAWYHWRQQQSLRMLWPALRPYFVITGAVFLASLLNPFGVAGLWYPFTVFQNYGYQIVENQSISFLENWGMDNPHFFVIKILSVALLLGMVGITYKRPQALGLALVASTFLVMSWLAIRNFTIAGLTAIPALAARLQLLPWRKVSDDIFMQRGLYGVLMCITAAFLYLHYGPAIKQQWEQVGIGPLPNATALAHFIQDNNVPGPIFNNYDIGGYLIYYLWPQYQVFVDNRPEAYPAPFFMQQYIPMQQDALVWQQQVAEHNLQSIVFWRHDLTPWAQQFLADRLGDKEWIPVYLDEYVIVFVRNNETYRSLIDRYDLRR